MINAKISDRRGNLRDPFEVLSEMAARMSAGTGGGAEKRSRDVPADVDPHKTEEAAKDTLWRALCSSAGLPSSGSDRVMWRLYTLGALETAVIWLYEGGFFAPFAWPEKRVVLLLAGSLAEWDEMSAEEIADNSFFDAARHAAFQQSGWIVLQVDPTSSTLDEELGHIVDLIMGSGSDEDPES